MLAVASLQDRIAHDRVRPDAAEQLVLGEDPARVRGHVREQPVRLGAQRQRLAGAPEALVGGVELELVRHGVFPSRAGRYARRRPPTTLSPGLRTPRALEGGAEARAGADKPGQRPHAPPREGRGRGSQHDYPDVTAPLGLPSEAVLPSPGMKKAERTAEERSACAAQDSQRRVPQAASLPNLPSRGAFVVQFRKPSGGSFSLQGRVEHVTGGRSAHFDSLWELLHFIRPILDQLRGVDDLRGARAPEQGPQPTTDEHETPS